MATYERFGQQQRMVIFWCLIACCITASLLNTVLNTVLPPIISDFQIEVSTAQWLTSGYSLVMAIAMPLSAFLITRYQTKPLYLVMVALFIVGLTLTGFATGFQMMMCGRVVQALGNGFLSSITQVTLLTIFPPNKRGTVMGWFGLSVGVPPVIAPTIGGIVADFASWRWIFFLSAIVMVAIFIIAVFSFSNVLDTEPKQFDIPSFALSALAFGGITVGIGNLASLGIGNMSTIACLAVGTISAVFFCVRQLRIKTPFLDIRAFKIPAFSVGVIANMGMYVITMGSAILLPLYAQEIAGQSATISGMMLLPGALACALLNPVLGRYFDNHGLKALYIAGCLMLITSGVGMAFVGTSTASLVVAALMNVMRYSALACLQMPVTTWCIGALSESMTPHGVALLNSLRTIAGAIGTAVCVGLMGTIAQFAPGASSSLSAGAESSATNTALSAATASMNVDASLFGMHITFLLLALLGVIMLAGGFIFKKRTSLSLNAQ